MASLPGESAGKMQTRKSRGGFKLDAVALQEFTVGTEGQPPLGNCCKVSLAWDARVQVDDRHLSLGVRYRQTLGLCAVYDSEIAVHACVSVCAWRGSHCVSFSASDTNSETGPSSCAPRTENCFSSSTCIRKKRSFSGPCDSVC